MAVQLVRGAGGAGEKGAGRAEQVAADEGRVSAPPPGPEDGTFPAHSRPGPPRVDDSCC